MVNKRFIFLSFVFFSMLISGCSDTTNNDAHITGTVSDVSLVAQDSVFVYVIITFEDGRICCLNKRWNKVLEWQLHQENDISYDSRGVIQKVEIRKNAEKGM